MRSTLQDHGARHQSVAAPPEAPSPPQPSVSAKGAERARRGRFGSVLQTVRNRWQQVLLELPDYAPVLCFGLLLLGALLKGPPPADDLLRHVVSYAWNYSHTAMYADTSLPDYNLYPLFDRGAGWLHQNFGPIGALRFVQMLALLATILVSYRVARTAGATPEAATLLTVLVLGTGVFQRAMLGRPELFAMAWAACALLTKGGSWRMAAFVLGGWAVSAGYWMAWLCWPLLLLMPVAWRQRVTAMALIGAFHAVFWHWHSDGQYWTIVEQVMSWNRNRLVQVSENGSLLAYASLQPAVLALGVLALRGWGSLPRKGLVTLGALASYGVLNMNRYIGNVALAVLPAAAAGVTRLGWSRHTVTVAAAIGTLTVALVNLGSPAPTHPHFDLPPGSKVLVPFGTAVFAVPFANPGKVSVLPAMEVGASSRESQALSVKLAGMDFECSRLRVLGVTHVVENVATRLPDTACMHLLGVEQGWRLWKVASGH